MNAYVLPGPVAKDDAHAGEFATAAEALTWVTPFSHRALPDGSIDSPDDSDVRALAETGGAAPLLGLTNTLPDGAFDTGAAAALLASPEAQDRLLDGVARLRRERGYRGLSLDFEKLRPDDREPFAAFLRRAAEREHDAGGLLVTAVAPKHHAEQRGIWHEAHDYALHAEVADRVVVMAYEWGSRYSQPGPIAPLPLMREVMRYATAEIPREKLLLGLGLYAYDWTLDERGQTAGRAQRLGLAEARSLAAREGVEIGYDPESESAWFRYAGADGRDHAVWLETARSLTAKLDLVRALGLRGVSLWRLPDPGGEVLDLVLDLFEVAKPGGAEVVSAA